MSQLAQALIAKEKEERTGYLDLGNCGLMALPEELLNHSRINPFSSHFSSEP